MAAWGHTPLVLSIGLNLILAAILLISSSSHGDLRAIISSNLHNEINGPNLRRATANALSRVRRLLEPAAEPAPVAPEPWNLYDEIKQARIEGSAAGLHQFVTAIHDRNNLGQLLEALGGFRIGVELGVQHGNFAAQTLRSWTSCKKYYLVDIWAKQENYNDWANVNDQDSILTAAKNNMLQFGSVPVIVRNYTTQAVHVVPGLVDFVYVDARHDYCGCMEDMNAWWPKIRAGGIMAGHDFRTAAEVWPGQDWGLCMDGTRNKGAVMGAVTEFAMRHGLHISVTYSNDEWRSWIIRKPYHQSAL